MILVCGEALVDLFLAPPEGAEIPARAVAGGSPFNVAIGISRLGGSAAFCGGLSTDAFGRHLAGMLAREGVSLDHARTVPNLTTISVVAMNAAGVPSYAFHGEDKADRMLTGDDLPANLPDGIKALTFGSYSLAVEPVGAAYLALAARESGRRVISLDPNVRPTVTPDMAAWRTRFDAFLAHATMVKSSDEDIATAYGHDADIGTVARDWLEKGPKLVVVTRGPDGALAYTERGEIRIPGRKVKVVDTVGAGDTFHAALLARLDALGLLTPAGIAGLSPDIITDLLRTAVVASSITCSRRGADLPIAAELAAALKDIS